MSSGAVVKRHRSPWSVNNNGIVAWAAKGYLHNEKTLVLWLFVAVIRMRLEVPDSKATQLKLVGFCGWVLLPAACCLWVSCELELQFMLIWAQNFWANKRARREPLYRSLWSAINKSWPTANLANGKRQRANGQLAVNTKPDGVRLQNCMFRLPSNAAPKCRLGAGMKRGRISFIIMSRQSKTI